MKAGKHPARVDAVVCCDCEKVLRRDDPKVSNGPMLWRCAACEYKRQKS